jgi:hypothetical protein
MEDSFMKTEDIVNEFKSFVKSCVSEAKTICSRADARRLETRVRDGGQKIVCRLFECLIQQATDQQTQASRQCPHCGERRRHKGKRIRQVVSSMGQLSIEGVYLQCPACGLGDNSSNQLVGEYVSCLMHELLCFLGTSMGSFSQAASASKKLLGVTVSDNTIRKLCISEGNKMLREKTPVTAAQEGEVVVGGCDGTMVNTRRDGWRELKAFRFDYGQQTQAGALLVDSERFSRHVRGVAKRLGASRAADFFFVTDAAAWIKKLASMYLPGSTHIIDVWHAWQHIWAAGNCIHGEGSEKAGEWSSRYCQLLVDGGAKGLLNRLNTIRYKVRYKRIALEKLQAFLMRNCERMAYDKYRQAGWPISSGPMESFCKQLGHRLKGPGMRWANRNVNAVAAMVSLLASEKWDNYWKTAV